MSNSSPEAMDRVRRFRRALAKGWLASPDWLSPEGRTFHLVVASRLNIESAILKGRFSEEDLEPLIAWCGDLLERALDRAEETAMDVGDRIP